MFYTHIISLSPPLSLSLSLSLPKECQFSSIFSSAAESKNKKCTVRKILLDRRQKKFQNVFIRKKKKVIQNILKSLCKGKF
jgi:hypothetical protein